MIKRINIHSKAEILQLSAGVCKVDILGGWGVRLVDFNIILTSLETNKQIKVKHPFLRLQSWEYSQRAKRIFTIDIIKPGEFKLEFEKSEQVEVKKSNLFLLSLITKKLPNEELEISILN